MNHFQSTSKVRCLITIFINNSLYYFINNSFYFQGTSSPIDFCSIEVSLDTKPADGAACGSNEISDHKTHNSTKKKWLHTVDHEEFSRRFATFVQNMPTDTHDVATLKMDNALKSSQVINPCNEEGDCYYIQIFTTL